MKQRLFVLNRYCYPDHSATSQMLGDLVFALPVDAFDITLLAANQLYDDAKARLPAEESVAGVRILRLHTTRHGRDNLAGRMIDYLSFYWLAFWRLLALVQRGDIVIVKTDPPLLALVVWPITVLRGAKLVHWLQDIFPETASELGLARGFLARVGFALLRGVRNLVLRRSAATVAIGELMAARVAGMGVPAHNIHIIPNFADGSLIRPIERTMNPLRAAWGLGEVFTVGYSGNLGRAHEIETLLSAIMRLADQDIRWLFIGGGAQSAALKAELLARGLTNVMFQPYQPRENLAESLCVPDLHLVSLRPELEGLIVPSKYYGIAAAGRPALFIGDLNGEIATLLSENATGSSVSEGDGEALAATILAYAAAPARTEAEGERARRVFVTTWDKPHAVLAWRALLPEVAQK